MKAWEVTEWAWTVPVELPTQRLVLLAHARRAGVKLLCWPGLEDLCEFTGLHRDTVTAARRALLKMGYLVATGERRGHWGRVAVLRINVQQTQPIDFEQSAENPADIGKEMSGKPSKEQPGSRAESSINEPGKPDGTVFEQPNEPVQGADAPQAESAQRVEGLRRLDEIYARMPYPRKVVP